MVSRGIVGPIERGTISCVAAHDIMPGRQHVRAEIAGRFKQVCELYLLVACNARDWRLAAQIAVGERSHDAVAETIFIIKDVVGEARDIGHPPGILNVLSRATGAWLPHRCPMVIELQGHADHVVTLRVKHRGNHGRIDSTRHRNDHAPTRVRRERRDESQQLCRQIGCSEQRGHGVRACNVGFRTLSWRPTSDCRPPIDRVVKSRHGPSIVEIWDRSSQQASHACRLCALRD